MDRDGGSREDGSQPILGRAALQRIVAESRVVSALNAIPDYMSASYRNSNTTTLGEAVGEWYRASNVFETTKIIGSWVRSSFLFRWLTKEPQPEVIVIDLTETRTVGPIIRLLDRGIHAIGRARTSSSIVRPLSVIYRYGRRRPIRFLSSILLGLIVVSLAGVLARGTASNETILALALLSVLATLGLRVRDSWEELRDRRIVRFARNVLEPPEPPEDKTPKE